MPRPKNKKELISLSETNFQKLLSFIDELPEEKKTEFPKGTLNRNVRDVLAHLHHWHLLFFTWKKTAEDGRKPIFPAEGYSWKTTPDLNREINRMYQNLSLEEAFAKFRSSHSQIVKLIQELSNEELFEKKRYAWTGSTSIGSYLVSATSSHYDWAFKLIKKATK